MPDATLVIEDLHVDVDDKQILRGVDLTVEPGRVHALMGPNGSGKSTLAYALAGHPGYRVTGGKVEFKGEDALDLKPDERARLGMFLAMQYPVEVPGVSVTNFLRTAMNAVRGEDIPVREFATDIREQMRLLDMDPRFAERNLNEGFSGGEKKRHEILQMALLRPELAILDETDSGLDVDALRVVAEGVNRLRGPRLGVLLITHYTRILRYISPDVVHVMVDGRVVESGGPELADQLEAEGYDKYLKAAQV
jgi:Fe-S cluster assembly ATP-binding protein